MISSQVIRTSIEELYMITKVNLCVFDLDGNVVASTFDTNDLQTGMIMDFVASPADSQVIGVDHLLKIRDEGEMTYILMARGNSDDTYMIAKIAVSQIQNLMIAYKERFDRNNFFQNLLLDNLLLVDIYNRAKKLHIEVSVARVVIIVETGNGKDGTASEFLSGMFSAQTIVDMMNTEIMMNVRVSYGTIVHELKDVSKSYKEAKMALEVGKIFYVERKVNAYSSLGIGRLIYQLPVNLCKIFIDEIFGENVPMDFDDETLTTINKFFENNLNVSETSRQLYVHRNTLVYRIEKLEKSTGLDIRVFDDALTFKIVLMVANYMKYLDTLEY